MHDPASELPRIPIPRTRVNKARRRARAHVEALAFQTIPLRVLPRRGRARWVLVLRFLRLSLIIAGGLLAASLVAASVRARGVNRLNLGERRTAKGHHQRHHDRCDQRQYALSHRFSPPSSPRFLFPKQKPASKDRNEP